MPEINRASDPSSMIWQLIDRETAAVNGAITWAFTVGDRVKIRLGNEMDSDHPMHHPLHIHGLAASSSSQGTSSPSKTSSGRTPCSCGRGKRWTSCWTSPIPGCGWRTATSPNTPRAG